MPLDVLHVLDNLASGVSVAETARRSQVSRAAIYRIVNIQQQRVGPIPLHVYWEKASGNGADFGPSPRVRYIARVASERIRRKPA